MAKTAPKKLRILAAGEVGAYTVCPLSWKLRYIDRQQPKTNTDEAIKGVELHRDWSRMHEEGLKLFKSIRWLAAGLCAAIVVFLIVRAHFASPTQAKTSILHIQLFWELIALGLGVFVVIDIVARAATRKRVDTGFTKKSNTLSIDGGITLPEREYISALQGLAGRPDAVVLEDGYVIPIERKPLAKKVRDRYVAQLLVYMRLIEEFEKKRPPYGYLILGTSCRRVRIDNTTQRQDWLQKFIDEMRAIKDGAEALPAPHVKKCSRCDVRSACPAGQDLLKINKKAHN